MVNCQMTTMYIEKSFGGVLSQSLHVDVVSSSGVFLASAVTISFRISFKWMSGSVSFGTRNVKRPVGRIHLRCHSQLREINAARGKWLNKETTSQTKSTRSIRSCTDVSPKNKWESHCGILEKWHRAVRFLRLCIARTHRRMVRLHPFVIRAELQFSKNDSKTGTCWNWTRHRIIIHRSNFKWHKIFIGKQLNKIKITIIASHCLPRTIWRWVLGHRRSRSKSFSAEKQSSSFDTGIGCHCQKLVHSPTPVVLQSFTDAWSCHRHCFYGGSSSVKNI